jgi:hypothetical protein
MTRARDENHLAIYPAAISEADQHNLDADSGIHQPRRGTKYAAAQALHTILTNNHDRARTMHATARRTDPKLLPAVLADLLDRNDRRRSTRAHAWLYQSKEKRAREAAYERVIASQAAALNERRRDRDEGYALEL